VEFDILFASGIDALSSLLEAAEAVGAVGRCGAYYYWGEARLGQGREGCLQVGAGGCACSACLLGRLGTAARRGARLSCVLTAALSCCVPPQALQADAGLRREVEHATRARLQDRVPAAVAAAAAAQPLLHHGDEQEEVVA
jgi:hypothetical protein